MINVDVVCEAEHLPRLKLLQTHMRSLNVELQIHETVPETCSNRLLIVPRQRNSKLTSLDVPDDCERIALFLDEQTEPIEADMQVTLHSWPARSSDRHVETLARHLHSGRRTLSDEDIRDSDTADHQSSRSETRAAQRTALQSKRAERQKNVFTLTLLGVGVVALVSLLESEPKKVDEQTVPDPEQQTLVEQADKIEAPPIVASEDGEEEEREKREKTEVSDNRPTGHSTITTQPSPRHTPEVVIIDETGARVGQGDAPKLCSQADPEEGLASEPCRLVLF
ncbi:MAG: hypothetical protein V2I41_00230 [Pseudomonadales bacterium]|jgi:hypothetical protein|nr:hypothetical protein [Pseudomonadales bacterium]